VYDPPENSVKAIDSSDLQVRNSVLGQFGVSDKLY